MSAYRITLPAKLDIDGILQHIAKDSVSNALRVNEEFVRVFELLARNPGIGHRREEIDNPRIRVHSAFKYLILYRLDAKPLLISRVIHGSRDLRRVPHE